MSQWFESIGLGAVLDDHGGSKLRDGGVKLERMLRDLYGSRDGTNHCTTYCDPRDWNGFDATGTNGISSIAQSAIAQSIADNCQLRWPKGIYAVDTPIDVGVGLYDGVDMCGVGPPQTTTARQLTLGNHGAEVIFISAMTDRPAFYNSLPLRMARFANFEIVGPNTVSQYQAPNDFKQNYNIGGCRDTVTDPLCGFALDSFNTAVPASGGYPGMTGKYYGSTFDGSSNCEWNGITIAGFVVNLGLGLSGVGSQGDTMRFINCQSLLCDTCIAIGQGQSKDCLWLFGGLGSARQALDGVNYGLGQGWPISMMGVNLGYLHRIFNYSSQFGPMFLQGNYAESVRSLGNYGVGGSTTRGHCSIKDMQFTMDNGTLAPPVLFETFGTASLRDVNFGTSNSYSPKMWNVVADLSAPVKCDTVSFTASGLAGVPPFIGATTGGSGSCVGLDNCLSTGTFPYQPLSDESVSDVSTLAINGRFAAATPRATRYANGTKEVWYESASATGNLNVAASGAVMNARSVTFATLANGAVQGTLTSGNWGDLTGWYWATFPNADVRPCLFTNGSATVKWGAWALTSGMTTPTVSVAGVSLSFTATDVTLVQVGDCYFWKMLAQGGSTTQRTVLAWIVTGIVGSVVTCQPMCDVTDYDTVANNGGGTTMVTAQRQWAPAQSLTCTTNSTTSLTAVSPVNLLKAGDWVAGTGIAANSRVVSTDGAGNITLNKAATASASGVGLHFGQFVTHTTSPTWT